MFDTSKKEMLNPNQGYKKIVMKLKQRYKVRNSPICPISDFATIYEFKTYTIATGLPSKVILFKLQVCP